MTVIKNLDIDQKLNVEYCIPLWLRDEQIKQNIKKVKARIEPRYDLRDETIAIVCYGPSLNDTWEKIKDFDYVITCSGAHKFLVDKGIIPDFHIEVDPRDHKIKLIGQPQEKTEYLIASTCHPKLLDFLDGFNVKLWHVFSNEKEAIRVLPTGEWALTGGSSVGLRALTMARFLGFHKLHVFGMDGSEGATGKHASEHPNQPSGYALTTYKGKEYKTTTSMLLCAKQTFHELDQMPDVEVKFYGEGLVQHMFQDYKKNPLNNKTPSLGHMKPTLITPEYLELNKSLHNKILGYGVGGGRHANFVLELHKRLQVALKRENVSILDYGCGKGYLAKSIPFPIWEYDPAIEGKEESPRPADLVVCTDVLEHIEPEIINNVLADLRRCTKSMGYFVISTRLAGKQLDDGRNAHLIVEGLEWWKEKLSNYFKVSEIKEKGSELLVIVFPRKK